MVTKIIYKFYSSDDKCFHIIKTYGSFLDKIDEKYDDFKKFYEAAEEDLTDANLLGYDFDDYNPNEFNLANAKISSKTMVKLGIYNNKLFNSIKNLNSIEENAKDSCDFSQSRILPPLDYRFSTSDEEVVICYISDIHILHKIKKNFNLYINDYELDNYIRKKVCSLKDSIPPLAFDSKVLIVGDVSASFELFKRFFKIYREIIPFKNTFFVIGNHEFWDKSLIKKNKNLDLIINKFRTFLQELNYPVILLENQLYLPNYDGHILNEKEILSLSKKEWEDILDNNGFGIFGGVGFAGLNKHFNYNAGIYRNAPFDRDEEIKRSKRVELIHEVLRKYASGKRIIFATHMPFSDWCSYSEVKNWVYISGHTHINYYIESDEKTIYADNQIGYDNEIFKFKFITTSNHYNIFENYKDGIYELERIEYERFYIGIGSKISFNRLFKKLYLVKRNNTYLFLIDLDGSGNLKILNGGAIKKAPSNDLNYYYEHMCNYATSIKMFLSDYQINMKNIANKIKSIGGYGIIHGCIIDIDYLNHLYVNPLDGKMTPYYATSIVDKYIYDNLPSLLSDKCPQLFKNYNKLLNSNGESNSLIMKENNVVNKKSTPLESIEMYKISRIIKGLQYIFNNNIIRLWSDELAATASKENGRILVSNIINPENHVALDENSKSKKMLTSNNSKQKYSDNKEKITIQERRKRRVEEYKEYVNNLSNGKISCIHFINHSTKAKYKCNDCGYEWEQRTNHFIERLNCKCPKCHNKGKSKKRNK